jgi:uncharacterized protein (UPF0548 family)
MFILGVPKRERLDALWTEASNAQPTYSEVGASAGTEMPTGYRHDRYQITLGSGSDVFDRAITALKGWEMHINAGLSVFPQSQPLALGTTVLVVVRQGPLSTIAPCRIVYVVEEPERFGFAYGTLPGHPEQGEEAFLVERSPDGNVRLTITAFSRPRDPLARMGGLVTRWIQTRTTKAYLDAMKGLAPDSEVG